MTCEYTIRWGTSAESTTRCSKPEHVSDVTITIVPGAGFAVGYTGDPHHEGPGLYEGQVVSWQAGDRREYRGEWPGYCDKIGKPPFGGGCVLPLGHHGRCAP